MELGVICTWLSPTNIISRIGVEKFKSWAVSICSLTQQNVVFSWVQRYGKSLLHLGPRYYQAQRRCYCLLFLASKLLQSGKKLFFFFFEKKKERQEIILKALAKLHTSCNPAESDAPGVEWAIKLASLEW